MATGSYTEEAIRMAKENRDFVIGFISRKKLVQDDESFIYMTPGVRLEEGQDALGQNYLSPKNVLENGGDILIVGRGIYSSKNIEETAEQYKKVGWEAYKQSI